MNPEENYEPSTHTCQNCDNPFEGKYCNQCGQKIPKEITSLKSFFQSLFKDFFHHAGIFLFTVKSLLFNPGRVIDEYLAGKRKKYYNALNFFLFIGSVSAFIALQSKGMDTEAIIAQWHEVYASMGVEIPEENTQTLLMFSWMKKHYNILLMIFLPIWSLATYWTFRKKGYNLGEHFIIGLFTYGFYALLSVPFLIIGDAGDPTSTFTMINFLLMFVWFAYAYRSIFKLNILMAILAAIWIYLFFGLLFGVLAIVIGFIVGLLFFMYKKVLA